MSNSKKTKPRGRPPKYVRDSKGREIVGLSYHKGVGQYYLTFSDPRYYLGKDREKAVESFHQRKEYKKLPPEAQEEARRKDEIYQKALELLNYDECIQEQLCKKARAELDKIFLQEDQYISFTGDSLRRALKKSMSKPEIQSIKSALSTYLYSYFVTNETKKCLTFSDISRDKIEDFIGELFVKRLLKYAINKSNRNSDFSQLINAAVNEEVQEKIRKEAKALLITDLDSLAMEKAYDIIVENPIKAAILTGIKELAYLAMCPITDEWGDYYSWYWDYSMPLPWWLIWEIYSHKDKETLNITTFDIQREAWKSTGSVLGMSKNVESITESDIRRALTFDYSTFNTLESQYEKYEWQIIKYQFSSSYHLNRLHVDKRIDALKVVSSRVLSLGYHQCATLCDILRDMY